MINTFSFQARARTIDHLGREQIADCPTAVSELWKNSYDAYAKSVGLHIYDGDYPVAVIVDDGHGMDASEFQNKWLVVGTESKIYASETLATDRCGLGPRVKQGQKGIGRLSSANLGSLLLIVSKRKDSLFVASLIDWRIFENPYLYLMDIEVPVVEFSARNELFELLPEMFDKLLGNVKPSGFLDARDERISIAWDQFSKQELSAGKASTTQSEISDAVVGTLFEEWHLSEWPLWRSECEHGTILLMSNIQSDLLAQLPKYDSGGDGGDSTIVQARDQLFQTLANISDPFLSGDEKASGKGIEDFSTRATARDRHKLKTIIDDEPPFDLDWLHELEHVVDGEFDDKGIFRGRVKAFGSWVEGYVTVDPPIDVPTRKDSIVGAFNVKLGTYEQRLDSTSHSEESYRSIDAKAERYAGLMVYRNGLRVMPYGREGTDFFQIEKRRTMHAGREFWSLRRLFGRVALGKSENPNLRDKAGREGIIDNKAAKVFRDLVINLLKTLARVYFGTSSEMRAEIVSDRIANYERKKIEDSRSKQKAQKRRAFNAKLRANDPLLEELYVVAKQLSENISTSALDEEEVVVSYRHQIHALKASLRDLALPAAPRALGLLEESYHAYRGKSKFVKEVLDLVESRVSFALDLIKPRSPKEIAYSELSSNAAFIHRRIRSWVNEARSIIASEDRRIQSLQEERNKLYHAKSLPLIDKLEAEQISLQEASRLLDEERDIQDSENSSLFESYVAALSSLSENIDISGLLAHSDDEADQLREEIDRLHALAQLGITVEIIGHEIESLESNVSNSLKSFPLEFQSTSVFSDVVESHEALIDRLRFLTPLKLSGPKTRVKISGKMIHEYILRFFKSRLESQNVQLEIGAGFGSFYIFDQPSRIYPVFINLINNSLYWVEHSESTEKKILLHIVNQQVVVSDSGPGVSQEDLKYLFSLFFTRKVRGGRGVGLYLCKANLAAGGHSINYIRDEYPHLGGANFSINFKGAKYE